MKLFILRLVFFAQTTYASEYIQILQPQAGDFVSGEIEIKIVPPVSAQEIKQIHYHLGNKPITSLFDTRTVSNGFHEIKVSLELKNESFILSEPVVINVYNKQDLVSSSGD